MKWEARGGQFGGVSVRLHSGNPGGCDEHACLASLSDMCLFWAAGNSGNAFDFVQFNCSQMQVDCSDPGKS